MQYSKINWNYIRSQFPATKKYIYLNAASTSPIPRVVSEAGKAFYDEILLEGVEAWDKWEKRVKDARKDAARLINASEKEICFTTNTGHGINIIADMLKGRGDIITMDDEYPTSTIPFIHRKLKVRFIKPLKNAYPIEHIEKHLTKNTKILVTSHIQYKTGFKQDLVALGEFCKKQSLIFVVNATQSGGVFPIDIKEANIDFLTFAGYKWTLAGFGNGILYINKKWIKEKDLPLVGSESVKDWDAMDNKKFEIRKEASILEIGAANFPPILALGAALKFLKTIGQKNIQNRIYELNNYLVNKLKNIEKITITTPLERKYRSGITIIKVANPKPLVKKLSKKNILISARGEGIRVSVHVYNNKKDIDKFTSELGKIIK